MTLASTGQDRRLEGLKEIGAAFVRPVAPRTVSRYIREHGLRVRRRFGRTPWCNLSDVRAFEREKDLAA